MDKYIYEENYEYFRKLRQYDQMTPMERSTAISQGREVDRLPVHIMADLMFPELLGMTVRESELSARSKADLQIYGYRMLGNDSVGMMHGLYSLPIALGGEYVDPDNTTRTLVSPPVKDIQDLAVLDLDNVNMEKDTAARNAFDALRYMREEIGEEVNCTMNFTAPFTVASGIVGVETFLIMLVREPDIATRIMDFALEAQFKLAEYFLKDGFNVGTSDPIASNSVISPRQYRQFAMPYEIAFAKRISAYTGKPLGIHICGQTRKILKDVADAGFVSFSMDNMVDLAEAKELVGDRMFLLGNVDPVGVMYQKTPEEVSEAVKNCYHKAWDSPMGFAIHNGCDLPAGVPKENILAYMETAKICATDMAKAEPEHIWDY